MKLKKTSYINIYNKIIKKKQVRKNLLHKYST